MRDKTDFLAGVIEGFYGQPWSQAERLQLFGQMAAWGLNTYMYGPKDDFKQRALWRELYSPQEIEPLRQSIRACQEKHLHFIYALSPGLDLRYGQASDLEILQRRLKQMLDAGCQHFALLFDDIPDKMAEDDLRRWGALAPAQCHVANTLFRWAQQQAAAVRFLFCPTPYCGRMAAAKLGGEGYLASLGRELLPEIDIFWTGPDIVSREITVAHARELAGLLRRKPTIWDNLHANDYDGRRFFCGPYAGRPVELRNEVAGLLSNPNCEFLLNYVPVRTLGQFIQAQGSWEPRRAYVAAMKEWFNHFATLEPAVREEDFLLLGDSYYLPHREGEHAERLLQMARRLLSSDPGQWGDEAAEFLKLSARLREFCARMADLKDRALFYAMSRRVWELREELDLLERYVAGKADPQRRNDAIRSDFHLPGTYRGGLVARLQRLLVLDATGVFSPAPPSSETQRDQASVSRSSPA